jgi:hypothetical protein
MIRSSGTPIIKATITGRTNDIPNNLDVEGSVTVGNTVISQTNAILSNADQNSVMITDGASAVSSVSGASGTLVYFEGTPPAPGVQTINTILANAGISFASPSYLLALASGSHSIADETSAAIGWSTTGTDAITDPAGNIAIDAIGYIVNINANGVYQIDCSIRGDGGGGRLGLVLGIHINPAGDGFTESIAHQTAQYVARGNTGELIDDGNVHMNTLVSLNSGDKIAFYVKALAFISPATILQNGTYLRITKVG